MPTDEPRVRPMRRSDADLKRFQAAFAAEGIDRSLEHLRWLFRDAPGGDAIVHVAEAKVDGEAVFAAIYAVCSLQFTVDGGTVRGVQSLDTLTDARFRGQGWFPRLATSVYAAAEARGDALVFGFPNGNSARGFFEKLGWTRLDPLPLLVRPLRTGALLRAAGAPALDLPVPVRRHRWRTGLRIEPLDRFDERFDGLWDRFSAGIPVAVRRDAAWANWRLVDRPATTYRRLAAFRGEELVGFVAWRETRKDAGAIGYLLELVAAPPGVARALLAAALREMRDAGMDVVEACCLPGGPTWEAHLAEGFLPVPERFRRGEVHFGARPFGPVAARATDRRDWYLSLADSDTL